MEGIAQSVRALVCGTRGRGFESHYSPEEAVRKYRLFLFSCTKSSPVPTPKQVNLPPLLISARLTRITTYSSHFHFNHSRLFYCAFTFDNGPLWYKENHAPLHKQLNNE